MTRIPTNLNSYVLQNGAAIRPEVAITKSYEAVIVATIVVPGQRPYTKVFPTQEAYDYFASQFVDQHK